MTLPIPVNTVKATSNIPEHKLANSNTQAKPGPPFHSINEVLSEPSMATFTPQEQTDHDRDCMTCKAKNISYLAPCKRSLLTLVFKDDIVSTLLLNYSN